MNLTEKVLAFIEEDRERIENRITVLTKKVNNYEGNEQSHRREKKKLYRELSYLTTLRRQVEKHTYKGGNCAVCHPNSMIRMIQYPCTFIKEVAFDLGIEVNS